MTDDSTLNVIFAFLLGGAIASSLETVFSLAAAATALASLAGRSTGLLLGRSKRQVDRLTAIGFLVGVVVSLFLIAADLAFGF